MLKFRSNNRKRSLLDRSSVRMSLIAKAEISSQPSFTSTGSYDEETNIEDINEYVIKQLNEKTSKLNSLKKQIQALESKLNSKRLRQVDRKLLESELNKIRKSKEELYSDDRLKEYKERVSPILEEWIALKQKEGPHFKFGEKRSFSPVKLSLIRSFIQVASEYIQLDLNLKTNTDMVGVCPYCRNPFDNDDGKTICITCGIYQDQFIYDVEFSDVSRINGSNSNNYVNRETFIKAMLYFQGKQKVEFSPDIWEKFNDYCTFNHINKTKLNYEQTRPIFKSIGFSNHFDDINLFLFMHPEIKKPLPDITKHESIILQDYDHFSQKYAEEKGDERDSALNAWYLLYILCRRRGIACNRSDLKMPDTLTIRISNDNIARRVFEALDWDFEDTV